MIQGTHTGVIITGTQAFKGWYSAASMTPEHFAVKWVSAKLLVAVMTDVLCKMDRWSKVLTLQLAPLSLPMDQWLHQGKSVNNDQNFRMIRESGEGGMNIQCGWNTDIESYSKSTLMAGTFLLKSTKYNKCTVISRHSNKLNPFTTRSLLGPNPIVPGILTRLHSDLNTKITIIHNVCSVDFKYMLWTIKDTEKKKVKGGQSCWSRLGQFGHFWLFLGKTGHFWLAAFGCSSSERVNVLNYKCR